VVVHGAAQIRRGKMMGKRNPRRAEIVWTGKIVNECSDTSLTVGRVI
jgi:hypothetical protein